MGEWDERLMGNTRLKLLGFNSIEAGLLEAYEAKPTDRFGDVLEGVSSEGRDVEYDAVRKIVDGEYDQAIAMLLELENTGDEKKYSVASNLGTAYELSGDLENARKWIAEGIKRNKDSHYGSEWIHLYILDFKMGNIKERFSELMQKVSVVNDEDGYEINLYGKTYTQNDIFIALTYQLKERLVFVKKDSPVVADLLLSVSMIDAERSGLEPAVKILALAEKFGDTEQVERIRGLRLRYEKNDS